MKNQRLISKSDEALWYGAVDQVRVTQDGNLGFIFKDGEQIEEYGKEEHRRFIMSLRPLFPRAISESNTA